MNTKHRRLVCVLGLLTVFLCIAILTACNKDSTCEHQWGERTVIKNASCTEAGVAERKCAACGQTKSEAIEPQGHDWSEATCAAPKTCNICAATDGEAAPHSYTVETVKDEALKSAASCTDAAVYYKSCACGAISSADADTFTSGEALAHSDKDGDNDHACDTCGKADITSHTFGEAACGNPAICSECGAAADQVPTHSDANLDHICDNNCGKNDMGACADSATDADHVCDYGCGKVLEDCADADTDTDHACDVCGKADITDHVYANDTVTKAPSCAQEGESTAYCACGKTQVTPIPVTDAHTFENGACTVCGKVGDSCNHAALHRESIDLDELGACGGMLIYNTCDCGSEQVLVRMVNIDCEMDELYEEDEYQDENGNAVMTMHGVCSCGLEITASAILYEDTGCIETYDFHYVFYFNDDLILDICFTQTYEWHQDREYVTVDLSEYGACGGTIERIVCKACNSLIGVYDIDLECDIDLDNLPEGEEVIDQDGVAHIIRTLACPDCSLKYIMDTVIDELSACEWIEHVTLTVTCEDSTIVTQSAAYNHEEHEYEYSYELHGTSCEDGVIVSRQCTVCGDSYTYETNRHYDVEYDAEIDLSEYGICEGTINVDRCTVCGLVTYINNSEISCDLDNGTEEEILNENGEVIGYADTYTCSVCGMCYRECRWSEALSPCKSKIYTGEYIFLGENCILEVVDSWNQSNHTYEYTYEIDGNSCEDGYTITEYCTVCGQNDSWTSYSHRTEYSEFDIADHGGCGGTIEYSLCKVCGEITYVYYIDIGCSIDENAEPEEYVDGQGYLHSVYTCPCPDCALTYVIDTYFVQQNVCVTIEYETASVYMGDECLFTCTKEYINKNHNYTYTYEMDGETCDDGYSVNAYCTVCGETDSWWSYSHRSEEFELDIAELGGCGGTVRGERCDVCGEITYLYSPSISCPIDENAEPEEYVDEQGNLHSVYTMPCPDCAFTYVIDTFSVQQNNCSITVYKTFSVYPGDECLFAYTSQYTETQHDYVYTYELEGLTCDDGYMVTRYCTVCGETNSWTSYYHRTEYTEISLDEYIPCGGYISEEYCTVCNTLVYSEIYEYCWLDYIEFNDEYEAYLCEDCGIVKYVFHERSENKDENCRYIYTETYVYSIDGEALFQYEYTYTAEAHSYTYEFDMYGTSCTDGYKYTATCSDCGYQWSSESHRHNDYSLFTLTDEWGCCPEHEVEAIGCICGYHHSLNFDKSSFTCIDNGTLYVCESCNLVIEFVDESQVQNGCLCTEIKTVSVLLSDEAVYTYTKEYVVPCHLYSDVQINVTDGVTYFIATCEQCGLSNTTQLLRVETEMHYGDYYYDYIFTPDQTAVYTIEGISEEDTYVECYKLEEDELTYLYNNDDGGQNNQFLLSKTLEAGTTYVFRISFYGQADEGFIDFAFSQSPDSFDNCLSDSCIEISVPLGTTQDGEERFLHGEICQGCGALEYYEIEYQY